MMNDDQNYCFLFGACLLFKFLSIAVNSRGLRSIVIVKDDLWIQRALSEMNIKALQMLYFSYLLSKRSSELTEAA